MGLNTVSDALADEAIEWFARLRSDQLKSTDRRQFFCWLKKDQLHQEAFVEVLELWEGLSVIAKMNFDELRDYPAVFEFKLAADASVG